ncbi:Rne/Rng family ribonuclease [Kribbella sp. NPDC059898]|uniref:Rne/Rng family ribonuclease n=1 Tax=Kribbella sp. NPDC059898 TaxID=3346995 RepID=UPI003655DF9F
MLDNEPTTEAAGTAAAAQPAARRTTKKTAAAKKTTTTRKRAVKKTADPEPAAEVAADATPAKKTAKKAVAKKAPAKKAAAKTAPAKKTTARRPAKKATAAQESLLDVPETAEAPAPATKTTRKRAAKKTAAPFTAPAETDAHSTGVPAAGAQAHNAQAPTASSAATAVNSQASTDAQPPTAASASEQAAEAPARKRTSRRRTTKSADPAAADATTASAPTGRAATGSAPTGSAPTGSAPTGRAATGSATTGRAVSDGATASAGSESAGASAAADAAAAEAPSTTRRSRRRPAPAAVLFQAPTDVPNASQEDEDEATETPATPEPGVDEQPATTTRRRRSRRGRDAEARETEARETEAADDAQPQAGTATDDTAEAAAEATTTRSSRRSNRGSRSNRASTDTAADTTDSTTDASTDNRAEARTDGRADAGDTRADSRADSRADGRADTGDTHADFRADAQDDVDEADGQSDIQGEDGEEGGEGTRRRRRRRGGRRRRKSGDADGAEDSADEQSDDEPDEDSDAQADDADSDGTADSDDEDAAGGSSRRRRRRRRRKGEDSGASADDPDETVVRVREPRSKNTANEITAVEGSTRLEAKKQRRREGRAAGRRRAPIVTEAEFLARRESVERTMVIRSREDLTQIAVSEDNVLVEHYVTTAEQMSLIGNVYLGRVQNVLPSMEAAFIDIGKGRNAVLYAGEVDWATLGGANGPRKIEQVLKSGQSVLVQVTKDPIGHKGARLTNQISLPGRYVVYVPRGGNGGISRKLPDTERNRLKTILKDIVPDEAGVIVRTAAEGASEEELTSDVSRLQAAWEEIDKKSKNGQAPHLLYGEPDLLIRVVRDLFTEDFAKLVISGDRAYDQVREYVEGVAPHLADRVEKWSGDGDVFASYRIDEQIKKALDRKVWLPSGGSLIIDRTEAMTVVDVNTGKFTGSGGNLEETVTKNNLEAAEEIVRQLRLRDIGGIIVIDFIDMVLESNRDLVLRRLVECLGRDRTKHQVAEVTSLGLVQMTRKRIGTGLLEAFSENCDHCGGRGLILHDEPKESRRQGRNAQNGTATGNGQQNGQDQAKAPQADEGGRKSSRRRRGKNRGDDEQAAEPEAPQHNGDAAQKLAQIAAATVKKDEDGTPEPTGYPVSADAEEHVSPEATGFPASGTTEEAPDAAQNGASKSTRRRRSSRSRSKTATEGEAGEPSELVTTGS